MTTCCSNKDGQNGSTSTKVCCVCRPYGDCYIMTAQVLSILGWLMSWTWWATFLLATPPMVMLQVVWCCKMRKAGLYVVAMLCALTSFGSLFAGMWMVIKWKGRQWCEVFTLIDRDIHSFDYYYDPNEYIDSFDEWWYETYHDSDYCLEGAWAAVAFVDSLLFGVAAFCTYHFARSRIGNYVGQMGLSASHDLHLAEAAIQASVYDATVASNPTAPLAKCVQSNDHEGKV